MDAHPNTVDLEVEDLLFSPNLYLRELDQERRTATFIQMSRANYIQSAFLDDRAIRDDSSDYQVNLDELLETYESSTIPLRPVGYIFHMAFGCSTLLARCIERMEGCFVLKEPLALHQLAAACPAVGEASDAHQTWHKTLQVTLGLLSKTYSHSDLVIVKADCVNIMNYLLDLHNESTGIFLYSELRAFLVSILKSAERRKWARRRLGESLKRIRSFNNSRPLLKLDMSDLNDAETAGLFWLTQIFIYRELQASACKSRLLALDGDVFVDSPFEIISKLSKHFGFRSPDRASFESICSNILSNHSKMPGLSYDRSARKQELKTLFRIFKDDLILSEKFVHRIINEMNWSELVPQALHL